MRADIDIPFPDPQTDEGWLAELNLRFALRQHTAIDRTVLVEKHFRGPLLVQKPFYPENGTCHVYLIHPPGGVVGGDKLNINILLNQGAHALITTPAANKFYRSQQKVARLTQHITIENGACLEWLPQETIIFDGSYATIDTRIDMAADAKLIAWEIICLARPAADESFNRGRLLQGLAIRSQGIPVLTDRLLIDGGHDSLHAQWGLRGFTVLGYMAIHPADADMRDAIRPLTGINPKENLSVSLINNMLVCRYLGYHSEQARKRLSQIWDVVRPLVNGSAAITPRIWLT
jgi:urease accessory protein